MRIRRFGHAGVTVSDLEAAEVFYRDVLGFEVAERYPDDGEVMLAVGNGDHLLLKFESDAGSHTGPALHHVAFELEEGHREIEAAVATLESRGIAVERMDHDGDAAVYFRDPDGHLLELYAAAGSTPRFETVAARLAAARRFVYATARPVDRAIFAHRFEDAPAQGVLAALQAHRNTDGGFGHALEPDVRCPDSQPIHVQTALELLREAGIRAPELADECCEYLSGVADRDGALPALRPGALDYPAAAHWQGASATEVSLGWTVGLAAELAWQGARHPWAEHAIEAAGMHLDHTACEAHQLAYAIRFAGTVLEGQARDQALTRLCAMLADAALFVPETPVARYGLTPLHYAPHPEAPAAAHFEQPLLAAHLDDLLDAQQGDGGWPIRFAPPSGAAHLEWRGRWTVEALTVLHAYGRL